MQGDGWCAEGATQAHCHRYHSWGKLPAAASRGKDRECPACRGTLSINPADIVKVWIVGHCHNGCEDRDVREALLKLGIDAACLGRFGLPSRKAPGSALPPRADPVLHAAARRSHAYQKLIGCGLTNGSLLKMCMQAISESDGFVAGDPELLLPRTYQAFIALAKRTGIERCHAAKLARAWISKYPAGVNP